MTEHWAGDPPEPIGTKSTGTGIVKWFNPEKGWGCIESKDTKPWDIWVHFSAIEGDGYRDLEQGQHVEFTYERANQDSFRYRATSVQAVRRGGV